MGRDAYPTQGLEAFGTTLRAAAIDKEMKESAAMIDIEALLARAAEMA